MPGLQNSSDPTPVAIVGAGALGTTLARRLVASGHSVEAVLSRTVTSARELADRVGAPVASDAVSDLPSAVRLVFVCVPDGAIASMGEALAKVDHPWPDTIVAHTSGAKTAAALTPLGEQGAATMSFHPLQAFAEDASPEAFEDIVAGLEGDERALAAAETCRRQRQKNFLRCFERRRRSWAMTRLRRLLCVESLRDWPFLHVVEKSEGTHVERSALIPNGFLGGPTTDGKGEVGCRIKPVDVCS